MKNFKNILLRKQTLITLLITVYLIASTFTSLFVPYNFKDFLFHKTFNALNILATIAIFSLTFFNFVVFLINIKKTIKNNELDYQKITLSFTRCFISLVPLILIQILSRLFKHQLVNENISQNDQFKASLAAAFLIFFIIAAGYGVLLYFQSGKYSNNQKDSWYFLFAIKEVIAKKQKNKISKKSNQNKIIREIFDAFILLFLHLNKITSQIIFIFKKMIVIIRTKKMSTPISNLTIIN